MSRIGKRPVPLPSGVTATIEGQILSVKGPKGTLQLQMDDEIAYKVGDDAINVDPANDGKRARAFWGMQRTLVQNLVTGVTAGYEKKLEIVGVGYRVALKGANLEFALGFSHPVVVEPPEGITFAVETPTRFSVSGIDKQLVGETAANIRKIRKPEPYKGKGVRYAGEVVRRKVGKTGK